MSHVLPTQVLFHSFHFSTHQNRFLIFPASTGDTLRIPPLYLDGQVKHHIQGRSDSRGHYRLDKIQKNIKGDSYLLYTTQVQVDSLFLVLLRI